MEIREETARAVFGIAVHSMNFGSGFLDDEEVASLREAAMVLGVDPMEATPDNFKCKYRGHHAAIPILDRCIFTSWPDGIRRNTYDHRDENGDLAICRAPVIAMWCPDCGRHWDAFEDTAYRVV